MEVSIVIPAFNEEKRLPIFLDSVLTFLSKSHDYEYEVIVVDDGSTDGTTKVVTDRILRHPNLRLVSLEKNEGKGAAVQRGILESTGDVMIFTDADGATPITELPHMIQALTEADIGIGNRWMNGAHVHKSTLVRHVAGWVYKTYMSMFGLSGIDTMCGFKGYRSAVAHDLFKDLQEKRWLFDTEIAYKAVKRGYRIKNFPIEWESKDGSKLDTLTLLKSAFQIFPLILKIQKKA